LGLENSSAKLFPKGTVLYAMYASIGECGIAAKELATSQAILGIQPGEKLDSVFLYYYLLSVKEKNKLLGQQGTQSNLNAGIVKNIELKLPSIIEQVEIAGILSTYDNEIDELKNKLTNFILQKHYLLNALMTGAIRTSEANSKVTEQAMV
jgi:type I restriction enzyme S subunit